MQDDSITMCAFHSKDYYEVGDRIKNNIRQQNSDNKDGIIDQEISKNP